MNRALKSTLWLLAAGAAASACSGDNTASSTATVTAVASSSSSSSSGPSTSSTGTSGSTGLKQCMGQPCQDSNGCCAGAYCYEGLCYENGVQPTVGASTGGSGSSNTAAGTGSASGGSSSSSSSMSGAATGNTSATSSASATGVTSSTSSGSRTSSTGKSGGKSSGRSSGTNGGGFSLGADISTHIGTQQELFNTIIWPPIGSKADGHVFVPGNKLQSGGADGWVHDIKVSTRTDTKTDFVTQAPFGGAYVDDQLSICNIDSASGGWDSKTATYDTSLGPTSSVDFGMCLGETAVPNSNDVAVGVVGAVDGAAGVKYLVFLDASNAYAEVNDAPEKFGVAPPVLPSWMSASATTIVTSGPGGGSLPDAGGTLLATDVATGVITRIADYDGGLFTAVAVSPDATTAYATYLTTAATNTNVNNPPPVYLQVYDLSTKVRTHNILMDGYTFSLTISPDGSILAALLSKNAENTSLAPFVECYKTSTMAKLSTTAVTENDTPMALAFSPDFNTLLVTQQYHYEFFTVRH